MPGTPGEVIWSPRSTCILSTNQNYSLVDSHMRPVRTALLLCTLHGLLSLAAVGQLGLPHVGSKTPAGNDQKAAQLLYEELPLTLDTNTVYPTVADRDLLGGPIRGQPLRITLDTLTESLAPAPTSCP